MARLGMLYAVNDDEVSLLKSQNADDMYDFMIEFIEKKYFSTSRACELDKAWEGIHFCFHNGVWVEDDSVQSKVIFSGAYLLDHNDHVITLKDTDDVNKIVAYLGEVKIEDVITNWFHNIDPTEYTLPIDDDGREYLLGWSEEITSFYLNAQESNLNVIFTVDL